MSELYMNGKYKGDVEDSKKFIKDFVEGRRKGEVPQSVSIVLSHSGKEIFVETSKGRVLRPLIVVKEGKALLNDRHVQQLAKGELSWSDLINQGIIEFIDASEEENLLVAFTEEQITKDHTHLEITPLGLFGVSTSLVPYGDYSPAARVAIASKNQKQGVGFYAANFPMRIDMDINLLHYAQMPIVQTIMYDIANYAAHPSGQNIVVAVMSYKGYTMDDAIILNKGSIERGFARSTYYRPAVAEELRYSGGLTDLIGLPDKDIKGYRTETDYRFLGEDGIIYPEAQVKEGDVIIGKSSPPRFLSSMDEYNLTSNIRRESSVSLRHGEKGIVDFVSLTENGEGNRLVQVRLREERIPEIGDKFTPRHGQKGVIGMILPHADMPFSATGITPDLIFSAHAIPSRMTISHLFELLSAKTGALSGKFIDGTTFSSEPEANIRKTLHQSGFRENGEETFYNGETGEQMNAKIFVGCMYYLKLKHMVSKKLQSRARGPIQLLTRQPTEGRAKEGGLRLGEMEKDTFIAHGAALLMKERFESDKVEVPICSESGLVGYYDARKNKLMSPMHGEDSEMEYVEMSYAFKLLLDELKSMGIYPHIKLEDKY